MGALVLSLSGIVGCGEPAAVVFIDNGGQAAMVVEVDGQPAAMIEPGEHESLSFPPGDYKFHVKSGGETLFDGSKTLERSDRFGFGRQYVWNPGGEHRYAACKVVYGSTLVSDAAENAIVKFAEHQTGQKADPLKLQSLRLKRFAEPMPAASWFELPPGILYILTNPPEYVYSRTGSDSRRALTRISKQDHAELQRTRAVDNPSERDVQALAEATEKALDSLADL
jgi:hypothetical protein